MKTANKYNLFFSPPTTQRDQRVASGFPSVPTEITYVVSHLQCSRIAGGYPVTLTRRNGECPRRDSGVSSSGQRLSACKGHTAMATTSAGAVLAVSPVALYSYIRVEKRPPLFRQITLSRLTPIPPKKESFQCTYVGYAHTHHPPGVLELTATGI